MKRKQLFDTNEFSKDFCEALFDTKEFSKNFCKNALDDMHKASEN